MLELRFFKLDPSPTDQRVNNQTRYGIFNSINASVRRLSAFTPGNTILPSLFLDPTQRLSSNKRNANFIFALSHFVARLVPRHNKTFYIVALCWLGIFTKRRLEAQKLSFPAIVEAARYISRTCCSRDFAMDIIKARDPSPLPVPSLLLHYHASLRLDTFL